MLLQKVRLSSKSLEGKTEIWEIEWEAKKLDEKWEEEKERLLKEAEEWEN